MVRRAARQGSVRGPSSAYNARVPGRQRIWIAGLAAAVSALAVLGLACHRLTDSRANTPNVILVTIDTLRADHLGIDGYPLDTSPSLDALAREGSYFTACYAQSAATGPSHASLFTSNFPHSTGVRSNEQQFPELPSLVSVLRAAGYRAAGFVSSVVLGRKFGMQKVFDHFDDQATTVEVNRRERGERPAAATFAAALDYLEAPGLREPFFLWIHLIDPHGPYEAPDNPDRFVGNVHYEKYRRELELGASNWEWNRIPAYQALAGATDAAFYIARYDGEIRYVDDAMGSFLARLKQLGFYDESLIAVTSDHGETLSEPGHKRLFSHGTIAYEEVVRVPLIVKAPRSGRALDGIRTDAPVTLLDLAPTLLALSGLQSPETFRGRDLTRARIGPNDAIFSFGSYGSPRLEQRIGTQFTVRKGPFRYIQNTRDDSEELYDHAADGLESQNIVTMHPSIRARLRSDLAAHFASAPAGDAESIESSREHAEKLKSLGYL